MMQRLMCFWKRFHPPARLWRLFQRFQEQSWFRPEEKFNSAFTRRKSIYTLQTIKAYSKWPLSRSDCSSDEVPHRKPSKTRSRPHNKKGRNKNVMRQSSSSNFSKEMYESFSEPVSNDEDWLKHEHHVHFRRARYCGSDIDSAVDHHAKSRRCRNKCLQDISPLYERFGEALDSCTASPIGLLAVMMELPEAFLIWPSSYKFNKTSELLDLQTQFHFQLPFSVETSV